MDALHWVCITKDMDSSLQFRPSNCYQYLQLRERMPADLRPRILKIISVSVFSWCVIAWKGILETAERYVVDMLKHLYEY